MAQQQSTIDSLTNQVINGENSSTAVMDQVLQCQMETEYQIEKLKVQAANAKTMGEIIGCNLRVKALTILTDRLLGISGVRATMPIDEEVAWARKFFGLQN